MVVFQLSLHLNLQSHLEGGSEYAMVLKSVSLKYKVFISRIGENDLITDEFVSNQPTLGSLFKSQNASTWEPSQWEDLKFKLNRANFVSEGTVEIYNPILSRGNYQIPKLMPDALRTHSEKVRVGLIISIWCRIFIQHLETQFISKDQMLLVI